MDTIEARWLFVGGLFALAGLAELIGTLFSLTQRADDESTPDGGAAPSAAHAEGPGMLGQARR
jgi:hypothetical protein